MSGGGTKERKRDLGEGSCGGEVIPKGEEVGGGGQGGAGCQASARTFKGRLASAWPARAGETGN